MNLSLVLVSVWGEHSDKLEFTVWSEVNRIFIFGSREIMMFLTLVLYLFGVPKADLENADCIVFNKARKPHW